MNNITLKVQPRVLIDKAGELSNEKFTLITLMEQTKNQINSLSTVWMSEASTEYQNRFRQLDDDVENMLAIVAEYISDLTDIGNVYITAEAAAKTAAEGLPTDGVFKA